MRKIVLIFVTVVLPCLLCARNDDKSTDALLRQIDGIIKNRQTYGAEKEARIADLKKLLSEATSDGKVIYVSATELLERLQEQEKEKRIGSEKK